jgi:membrane-bound metal-dependent hydrolase YbcI (DUF457 family)
MKGFTHFISATALASCVPGAAAYAVEHTSYILVLGGVFGLLPDTLDFKLNRFLHHYDYMYEPAQDPDPQEIAEVLAAHIQRAADERRTIDLHLHTIKLSADLWRVYTIRFDQDTREIVVNIGPIVNTGKVPVPGSEPTERREGRARVTCDFVQSYAALTTVSIFSGPSFALKPKHGFVDIQFIPWHRGWTHSLTFGLLCGLVAWGLAAWYHRAWLYPGWMFAAVITVGNWTHIFEDQFGFMGSNLLAPFTSERARGFRMMHAMDALPNFLTVWLSVALLFWNLYRANPPTAFSLPMSGFSYLVYVVIVPVCLMIGGAMMLRPEPAPVEVAPEESEDDDV